MLLQTTGRRKEAAGTRPTRHAPSTLATTHHSQLFSLEEATTLGAGKTPPVSLAAGQRGWGMGYTITRATTRLLTHPEPCIAAYIGSLVPVLQHYVVGPLAAPPAQGNSHPPRVPRISIAAAPDNILLVYLHGYLATAVLMLGGRGSWALGRGSSEV